MHTALTALPTALLLGMGVCSAQNVDSLALPSRDTIVYRYTPVASPVPTDTISYRYTPAARIDAGAVVADTTRKESFIRRWINRINAASEDKTIHKKIDVSFAVGPYYSKNTSFGLGLLVAGAYRLDRTDLQTTPSNVSVFGRASLNGLYSFGVEGTNIFRYDKHRIIYAINCINQPYDFWGIGYDAAVNNAYTDYISRRYTVNIKYLYNVVDKLFVGTAVDFEYFDAAKMRNIDYLEGRGISFISTGLTAIVEYDSRDYITEAHKGLYLSLSQTIRPKGLCRGSSTSYRTVGIFDSYNTVWKGGVIATDLYAEYNSDTTPWSQYVQMGGNYRMRGYYQGRFIDRSAVMLQVEVRQHIWRRFGCTAWVGAGNVFGSFQDFDWSHTMPTYGVGVRWAFKNRMNVRLDYGFGKKVQGKLINSIMFSINEAF